jgi:hypothetical protein
MFGLKKHNSSQTVPLIVKRTPGGIKKLIVVMCCFRFQRGGMGTVISCGLFVTNRSPNYRIIKQPARIIIHYTLYYCHTNKEGI